MRLQKKYIICLLFVVVYLTSAYAQKSQDVEKMILIETDLGNIKVKLYNQTPLHRDNFLKLVKEGFYNDILFHRVINQFMIQAGDPDSKKAEDGAMLGNGDPGYTIPAEIIPGIYHKRGALAAARQSDDINPKKESSGSQFYIVQGSVFSTEQIINVEHRLKYQKKLEVFKAYINKPENSALKHQLDSLQAAKNNYAMGKLATEIAEKLAKEYGEIDKEVVLNDDQINIYTTIGGAPHLDGSYTVFGEVVEGMDVVDKIAVVETDANSRPKQNVKIKSMKILN